MVLKIVSQRLLGRILRYLVNGQAVKRTDGVSTTVAGNIGSRSHGGLSRLVIEVTAIVVRRPIYRDISMLRGCL